MQPYVRHPAPLTSPPYSYCQGRPLVRMVRMGCQRCAHGRALKCEWLWRWEGMKKRGWERKLREGGGGPRGWPRARRWRRSGAGGRR